MPFQPLPHTSTSIVEKEFQGGLQAGARSTSRSHESYPHGVVGNLQSGIMSSPNLYTRALGPVST